MNGVRIFAVGEVADGVLAALRTDLARALGVSCEILTTRFDPAFALHVERRQYSSSEILARMQAFARPGDSSLLGVTSLDLYIPILTFVFGEAQIGGACAVVSYHRLRQEFYGLPADAALLRERLLKEAVHELGHTMSLAHCNDYRCVMAPSHAVEWIDVKQATFCDPCRARWPILRPA